MRITRNRWLRAFLVTGVYLLGSLGIMATGGGGGGGDDDFDITSVQIEPVSAATYDDEIELKANITFFAGEDVDFPYFASVTWRNSLTGDSFHHSARYWKECRFNLSFEVSCIIRGPRWFTQDIPLTMGRNQISVSIESDAGTVTDSILVEKFDISLPPSPPGGVTVVPVDTGVSVSWNPVPLANSYNIYYATAPGVTKANYLALPNGNKLTIVNSPASMSGFVPGSEYYFVVTSDNSIFESDESVEVSLLVGPTINVGIKTFEFAWPDIPGKTHYRLLENPDGLSGYNQVGGDIPQGTGSYEHIVPLYERINAQYILQECNGAVCNDYHLFNVTGNLVDAVGYFKASNPGAGDEFGRAVSLSGDGSTLVVAAGHEDSGNGGINPVPDDLAENSGAVYVFSRDGGTWVEQAYIKAANPAPEDYFGGEVSYQSVSLSDDGNTLAVGALWDDSFGFNYGSVYIFVRNGSNWTQEAHLAPNNIHSPRNFGASLSLSSDGNLLAIGSPLTSAGSAFSGAAYVFSRTGNIWTESAYLTSSNLGSYDSFGASISLSGDGITLAIGAPGEDSSTTGVNSAPDDLFQSAGASYVFVQNGGAWTEQAYIKASSTSPDDNFGSSISLNENGNILVVGVPREDSSTRGINTVPDELYEDAGAAYVFKRDGIDWSEQAYVKPAHSETRFFGQSVSLSSDGNTLAIGDYQGGGNEVGVNPPLINGWGDSVSLFKQLGGIWQQKAYIKTTRPFGLQDEFGIAVSLSDDGDTLAVGAPGEDSASSGIGGDQDDDSLVNAGAVYLY